MKRTDTMKIGDVMRLAIEECCMTERLDQCRAADLWAEIVGAAIARRTTRPSVAGKLMTVGVPDAALRQELTMQRSAIVREINRLLGKTVISDIRFVS